MRIRILLYSITFLVLSLIVLFVSPCFPDTRSTIDVRVLEIFRPQRLTVSTATDTFNIQHRETGMYVNDEPSPTFFCAVESTVHIPGRIKRAFHGTLKIYPLLDELVIINRLPINRYLASVVGAEMGLSLIEAQKAQAIVSRTYLFYNLKRHQQYDFCDLTHCQVYKGIETETAGSIQATAETEGMLLYHNGSIANLFYHSTCGGKTAHFFSIFTGDDSGLVSVSDSNYCSLSPHFEWEWSLAASEAPFQELRIISRGNDGRVHEVLVDGNLEQGWAFRMRIAQAFGWNKLKSSWFSVKKQNGVFHFSGHGLGHGLGMCQWGARKHAEDGKSAEEILRHYYPKLQLRCEN